jgi:NADH-quinone oxidoreductase subunit K
MIGSESALNNYLVVGALLFALGLVGFVARRNLIVMFLCAELMLQGVSVTLVGFSAYHGTWAGQVFALFSLALAAAEAGIALALFVVLFRRGESLDVSLWQDLRESNQPPLDDDAGQSGRDGVRGTDPVPGPGLWPRLTPSGKLPLRRSSEIESLRAMHPEPVAAGTLPGKDQHG